MSTPRIMRYKIVRARVNCKTGLTAFADAEKTVNILSK